MHDVRVTDLVKILHTVSAHRTEEFARKFARPSARPGQKFQYNSSDRTYRPGAVFVVR